MRDRPRRCERRVLVEDPALELLELGARIDAQLFGEQPSPVAVCAQGLRLPAAPVQRQHQPGPEPLAQWMTLDEKGKLGDELGVTAQVELGLGPFLESREPELFEVRDLGAGKSFAREVGQCVTSPQGEGIRDLPRPARRIGRAARRRDGSGESIPVELSRLEHEPVAGTLGQDPGWAEQLPKDRDVSLERLLGGRRRLLAPQGLDEPVRRHTLVRMEQEQRKEPSWLGAGGREVALPIQHLEAPKDPEVQPIRPSLGKRVRGTRLPRHDRGVTGTPDHPGRDR
jgi:hypothetical protein